ncbi:cytochrome P450 [Desarmillaria tabescens]|uniref:Cytochrome P450 n=1 Tax=Armillaria tabescens TaxID=1929756 RepID=A0AA39MI78_ARMTA|nr:cytochrome P450 [Desarmillaria tabescens]KAK0434405.1 cytochrome P450 [Desarmillaria tabescens]
MLSSLILLDIAIALADLVFLWYLFRRNNRDAPFPPGPRGLPLIGNLLDMPSEKEWLTFAKWGEKYGDIVSVSILGRRLVVINSAQMAISILDKKSSIYSDRPVVGMGGELVGWRNSLALMPYGARFRNHRRLAHQLFGNNATMNQFLPMLESEMRRSLKRIFIRPEGLSEHIRKTAGSIILQISHGYVTQEDNDPFIELAERTMNQFSLSTASGGFLANLIPILTHIPDWFPGAGFKRTAREWASTLNEFVEKPYNYVKQEMAAGTARHSLTSSHLGKGVTAEEEYDIKWLAATLYAGGADTTVAAIYAFFKAMLLYPEIQAKAQAEIDAVIGDDRLPRFDDRERLPYVNALALEVTRWHAVGPAGLPHCVTEDDVQFGYFIPKGSLVYANIWKMLHDPAVYDQPFEFKPERFIRTESKEPEFDPHKLAFGFGRRICPGRVLADASIFISCAMALSAFTISKCSEDGITLEPDTEHTAGTISHPTAVQVQNRS